MKSDQTTLTPIVRARVALMGAAVGWSLGGAFIKWLHLDATLLVGWRSLFAGLTFVPVILMRRSTGLGAGGGSVLSTGGFALAAVYSCVLWLFVSSTSSTSAAAAIFLQYTAPVWVAVLALVWLKERVARRTVVGIGVALTGLVVIFLGEVGRGAGSRGMLYGLGAGVAFAVYTVLQRRYRDQDPLKQAVLNNLVAALATSPWWVGESPPAGKLAGIALMGAVQLGLPYVLFAYGLRRVPAQEAALFTLIEPVLNPVWAALAVGEHPSIWTLLGGGLVLGALFFR